MPDRRLPPAQTWMTGGAVQGACERVRSRLLELAAVRFDLQPGDLALADGAIVRRVTGRPVISLVDLVGDETVEETFEYYHRPTEPIDDLTGRGDAHIAFAYAAHRAVVDVDTELGLVRVVELAAAQDVGRAINPRAVEGQIEGGSAQGLGLALLEEVQIVDGVAKNPSFTDYLIPTILDMPPMDIRLFEFPHPDSPYGLNGVGELPNLSSTPAIVNALRNATGLDLPRVPVRPLDLTRPPEDHETYIVAASLFQPVPAKGYAYPEHGGWSGDPSPRDPASGGDEIHRGLHSGHGVGMTPLRTVVVGVGAIGSLHARIYAEHPLAELVGVVDANPQTAEAVARPLGVPWFTEVSELVESCDFEAASVSVPEHHRYEIAVPLARAGKHLLLEKPLASTLAETDRLVSDVERTGVLATVNFILRFDPRYAHHPGGSFLRPPG